MLHCVNWLPQTKDLSPWENPTIWFRTPTVNHAKPQSDSQARFSVLSCILCDKCVHLFATRFWQTHCLSLFFMSSLSHLWKGRGEEESEWQGANGVEREKRGERDEKVSPTAPKVLRECQTHNNPRPLIHQHNTNVARLHRDELLSE